MLVREQRLGTRSRCYLGCKKKCWRSAWLLGSESAVRGRLLALVVDQENDWKLELLLCNKLQVWESDG